MNSNKRYQNIELLAPAGSMETFQAVIHAGADAVYLGGGRFGARAYANNFTEEELLLAIDYAHIHGRKVCRLQCSKSFDSCKRTPGNHSKVEFAM